MNWPDWLIQLLTAGAGAAGVYAGIRADLARLHERTTNAKESADKAHERIDTIMASHR